jgi:CRP/FNR family transcriptional regulator
MYHKLDIAIFFTHLLAERCLTLNKIIDSFTAQDLSVRLARYLLQFIADNNIRITKNKLTFDLPILKKDLANVLGTLPETLSRTFNKLHRQGLIKVFGKKIVVLNYEKLRQFA